MRGSAPLRSRLPGRAEHEEAQSVEADQDGTAFVADDAEGEREGETQGGDDENEYDGAGEDEVLIEDAAGAAGVGEEEGDVFEAVAHEDDIGGFHGDIGAGGTHGHAQVGHSEGWGIVDSVANHHDGAFAAELADDAEFVLGEE